MAELDRLLSKYNQDLIDLDLPSYYAPSSSYKLPITSPIVTKLKLAKIKDEFDNIRNSNDVDLLTRKGVISQLQSVLDEKIYVSSQLCELWINSKKPVSSSSTATSANASSDLNEEKADEKLIDTPAITTATSTSDLSSLRKRLLSNSKASVLDKSNDYHDSIQEDILLELTGFAQNLKSSAMKLSSKIVEDAQILEKTNENLLKNSDLMGLIDKNLNSYVLNKTGGKISFWFLMKVLVAVFVAFFLMVALIKIFPKM